MRNMRNDSSRSTAVRFVCFRPACRAIALLLVLLSIGPALAETVEVAPGVKVTKRVYSAPVNEQPFYGFADKSAAMREADEHFLASVIQLTGSREKAFQATMLRGWRALGSGNASEAARRFNEAFLLMPEQSEVYHGLAAVAQVRFNDTEFADELFRVARKQPNPLKTSQCGLWEASPDRQTAARGAAGAGTGGQGHAGFRRRMDQSCLGAAANR